MKTQNLILLILISIFVFKTSFSQNTPPNLINYQAIAHGSNGDPLVNQQVDLIVKILDGTNSVVWSEEHNGITTNDYGLITLMIGNGTNQTTAFSNINWAAGIRKLEIEINDGFGFNSMGINQLVSVPYAFHAISVENDQVDDADNNATNELQNLSISGNSLVLSITGDTVNIPSTTLNPGPGIDISGGVISNIGDNDNDPNNEIELPASGNTNDVLTWNGTDWVALPPNTHTDSDSDGWPAAMDLDDNNATITFYDADNDPNNEIELPASGNNNDVLTWNGTDWVAQANDGVNDADADSINEIQTISINGSDISLSNGGGTITIPLTPAADGSETIINAGTDISVTGTGTSANPYIIGNTFSEVDGDAANEVITSSNLNAGGILSITEGSSTYSIDLSSLNNSGTDDQNISGSSFDGVSNDLVIGIESGTSETIHLGSLDESVTAGTGISVTESNGNYTVENIGDTDASDDITNSTTAGGDLSGTYPNPTVAHIQGIPVEPNTPTANQILMYNGTSSSWEPSNLNPDGDWTINGSDMYSTVTGKVGVGTTNPLTKFHVNVGSGQGIIQSGEVLFNNNALSSDALSLNLISGNSSSASVSFGDNGNSYSGRISYNNSSNSLDFWTNNTPNRLLINSSGYIGVNNASPSAYLDVVGSFQYDDGNQQNNYILKSDASGNASWVDPTTISTADDGDWNKNGTHIENANSGNVGIGPMHSTIGGPGYFLTSGKALTIATTDSYSTQEPATIELVSSSASSFDIMGRLAFGHVLNAPNAPIYLGGIEMNKTGDMIFSTNGNNEYLRINSSGKVGIGNQNPSSILSVGNDASSSFVTNKGDVSITLAHDGLDTYLETRSGDMSEGLLMLGDGSTESGIIKNLFSNGYMNNKTNNALYMFNKGNEPIIFETNDTERMKITGDGTVGIGTTNPTANLHITPNSTMYALRIDQGTSGNGILSYVNTTSSSRTLLQATSNVNGFIVKGDGNVGIGTISPSYPLTIETSTKNRSVYITNNNNTTQTTFGIYAGAFGTGSGDKRGGSFDASGGSGTNIGVRAYAGGGTTNWALYSIGDSYTTAGAWTTSDKRFKTNIENFNNAINKIKLLPVKSYYFNTEKYPTLNFSDKKQYGIMAQDLEKIFPEMVLDAEHEVPGKMGESTDEKINIKAVNYNQLIPVLIKGMQEQQEMIINLQKKIDELERNQIKSDDK